MSHTFPEYTKPKVDEPFITSLTAFSPEVLNQIVSTVGQSSLGITADQVSGLGGAISSHSAGGLATQTPGAVPTVNIAHGLGVTPSGYSIQPGNLAARGAPAAFLTADTTNVTLNFAANLTAATSYVWIWTAIA